MKIPFDCKIEECTSQDETRIILHSAKLHIADGKGTLVATDGRVIVSVPVVVDATDTPGLIHRDMLSMARERAKKEEFDEVGEKYFVNTDVEVAAGERVAIKGGISQERGDVAKFPNDAKCWELKPPTIRLHLDANMLVKIQHAMGANNITLECAGEDCEPILVTPCYPEHLRSQGYKGVIMPVRKR